MRGVLAGVAVVTMGFFGAQALTLRANERPAAKGPMKMERSRHW